MRPYIITTILTIITFYEQVHLETCPSLVMQDCPITDLCSFLQDFSALSCAAQWNAKILVNKTTTTDSSSEIKVGKGSGNFNSSQGSSASSSGGSGYTDVQYVYTGKVDASVGNTGSYNETVKGKVNIRWSKRFSIKGYYDSVILTGADGKTIKAYRSALAANLYCTTESFPTCIRTVGGSEQGFLLINVCDVTTFLTASQSYYLFISKYLSATSTPSQQQVEAFLKNFIHEMFQADATPDLTDASTCV